MLSNIDETRLPLVREIVDATGAKIVLSSSWRKTWVQDNLGVLSTNYINSTFAKCGLEIFDKTPDLGVRCDREDEILKWLNDTHDEIESFVVIDDEIFGWEELRDNFVATNPNFGLGLEEEHVQKAIEILNRRK